MKSDSCLDNWIKTKGEQTKAEKKGTTLLVTISRFEMPGSEELKRRADSMKEQKG